MVHPIASQRLHIELCSWPDCTVIADHPDHPLCERHYRKVGMMFIHENIDVMRAVAGAPTLTEMVERIRAEDPHRAERQQVWAAERTEKMTRGVVYYVRIGEYIKIGTSVDFDRRMLELYIAPENVLATEPGGHEMETKRHRQFADERFERELFVASDRLMAHIAELAS